MNLNRKLPDGYAGASPRALDGNGDDSGLGQDQVPQRFTSEASPTGEIPGAQARGARPADASSTAPHSGPGGPASPPAGGLWADILGLFTGVVASTETLIEVYRDRARLEVRRQIVRAALGLVLLTTTVVWCVAASLSFLRGLVGGFAAWLDGRLWLGELLGGATALGLAAGLLALVLWVRSRREFSQLQAKYRRMRNEPTS